MAESVPCHIRRIQADSVSWTALTVPMLCSKVAIQFAVFEAVAFRTDPDDPETEMAIPEGKEEVFEWPHGGLRPIAGAVFGYVKSASSVGDIIVKATT